nr:MAG TPA: hypothetical protein [Crassvirales sp.]
MSQAHRWGGSATFLFSARRCARLCVGNYSISLR